MALTTRWCVIPEIRPAGSGGVTAPLYRRTLLTRCTELRAVSMFDTRFFLACSRRGILSHVRSPSSSVEIVLSERSVCLLSKVKFIV